MSEDLIRKIAGLLATAESLQEAGNEEAAGAYIAKAHQLQQKYSIDQAMLDARSNGTAETEPVVSRTVTLAGAYGRRRVHLAHYVAKHSDCTGYYTSGRYQSDKAYRYTVFGHRSDVEWVETLLVSLNHQLDMALAVASRNRPGYEHPRSFGTAFVEGFAQAINRRLAAAKRQAHQEAQRAEQERQADAYAQDGEAAFSEASRSVSLVLANKRARVEAEMRAQVGPLGRGSTTSTTSSSGYRAGSDAGQRASLARGSVSGGARGSLG